MKVPSILLPHRVRDSLRRRFDSIYGKPYSDKETIGGLCQWTICIQDLNPGSIIYSGGVGTDISFELELIRRFGVRIQLFDPSPIGRRTVALADASNLVFKPVGLSADQKGTFSVGGEHCSQAWYKIGGDRGDQSIPCTTIAAEMAENGHDHIDLLKIDIEGFEYEVLRSCLDSHIPIKQICVEFHDFFPEISREKTRVSIGTLKSHGYELIHKHRHDYTFYYRPKPFVADHASSQKR